MPVLLSYFPLLNRNRLVDCYASYFGALTCVAWSPDGRFVLVCSKASETERLITVPLLSRRADRMIF